MSKKTTNTTTATTNTKANSKETKTPAVYGFATEDIIKLIETDKLLPWKKTWSTEGMAHSVKSNRTYNMLNQMMLGKSGAWGSFKTWSDLGYKVKKGEKASRVYEWFYSVPEKAKKSEDDKDSDKPEFKRGYLKYYPVFHESQVETEDGKPYKAKKTKKSKVNPIESAEKFVADYKKISKIKGIVANKTSNDAYYDPKADKIVSPKLDQYKTANDFYSTLFHEIIHSTGHKSRLDRGFEKSVAFGSEDYSREELVAELGSAIVCARLGIDNAKTVKDSAKYCKGWIKALRGDTSLLISASSYAEKAVKYAFGEC